MVGVSGVGVSGGGKEADIWAQLELDRACKMHGAEKRGCGGFTKALRHLNEQNFVRLFNSVQKKLAERYKTSITHREITNT